MAKPLWSLAAQHAVDLTAKHGDPDLYDRYFQQARASSSRRSSIPALWLTAFEKPELVKRTLDYSLSSDIRNQDFEASSPRPPSRWPTTSGVDFIKSNWSRISPKLATTVRERSSRPRSTSASPLSKADVESFFTSTHRGC